MEDDEPSVGFGDWHTHEGTWSCNVGRSDPRKAILDLIADILEDRIILFEDIGGPGAGSAMILNLTLENALLEELTEPHSPGRVYLRSWSGRLDREASLADFA